MIEHKKLREILDYDPESGEFYFRIPRRGHDMQKPPGYIKKNGYKYIKIQGKIYRYARLIWFYVHGIWPDGYFIDHINHDPLDNRLANLRLATPSQSSQNRRITRLNKVGFKGVCWNKQCRKYQASIYSRIENKSTYLGLFHTPEEAAAAYQAEARKRYGEFYCDS